MTPRQDGILVTPLKNVKELEVLTYGGSPARALEDVFRHFNLSSNLLHREQFQETNHHTDSRDRDIAPSVFSDPILTYRFVPRDTVDQILLLLRLKFVKTSESLLLKMIAQNSPSLDLASSCAG